MIPSIQSPPKLISMALAVEPGSEMLPAVIGIFNTLNRHGIRYCHWKSNLRLKVSLAGRTDLDLLVDPQHERLFKQILSDQGIKRVVAPAWKHYPGMEHYIGFDPQSGRLFHLHIHYLLVLGEQYVKNYRLPLEKEFLGSTRQIDGVKIPPPELELIVLSLRALLKYRDRDVLKDILSIRSPGIPQHIVDEILWLLGQTSSEKLQETLASLPLIARPEIITELLELMQASPRNGMALYRLRTYVRKLLRPYQRHSRLAAAISYFRSIGRKIFIQRSAPDRQMVFPEGGLTVALVGVDGAGKSTLSAQLTQWLRWKIDSPFYYLGSKQPSLWTKWSYIFFRMARRGHRDISAVLGEAYFLSKWIAHLRQILLASHYLLVGRDRYARFRFARKEAKNGSVVIFDRYPFVAPLDGPEIHLIDDGRLNPISKKLSMIERSLYEKFAAVDLLLMLEVSLQTSLQRKPDHAVEMIKAKNIALEAVKARIAEEHEKWNMALFDAEMPIDNVLLLMKRRIWASL